MKNLSNDQTESLPQEEQVEMAFDSATARAELLNEKMADAMIPGYQAEFDAVEAEQAGAFQEDALSEADALDSNLDLFSSEGL